MLSYARSITPSRGLLYACSNLEGSEAEPLIVEKRGLRGTKSFDIWAKVERAKRRRMKARRTTDWRMRYSPIHSLLKARICPKTNPT